MKIQDMFQKDIHRKIGGVVRVGDDNESSLKQEMEEYIITKELKKHFGTFLDNYIASMNQPTNDIGVWISGFFGSGKSHFLKILSYLLSNKEVAGKKAVDYFKDKFDDPIMNANIARCAEIPTESILFDISGAGPAQKGGTAVQQVFFKTFYEHLGYFGNDLKVARLEMYLDKQGKLEEFRGEFEKVHGRPWGESRKALGLIQDKVVSVLKSVLGMSEGAARKWLEEEPSLDMAIDLLAGEINEYVNSKGKGFRLLFCIDEVGQYIGEDGGLMLNLQTIVEMLGTKCMGKVWVMVTSQEAIDSVVKLVGGDFSKIQARFNTRLSLSSSSVAEVIKKRILEKNGAADKQLRLVYETDAAGLKNIFAFKSAAKKDIKGFAGADEFAGAFPFVPYQFQVLQDALAEIRKHGHSGKGFSGGERSMLSAFQDAAKVVSDGDDSTLVPFWMFYDTILTFLDGPIRRVVDRCQEAADKGDGLKPQDVEVLKLLYLLRYNEDFKANIDNLAILSVGDTHADMMALRQSTEESLKRLEAQNYVARDGEAYAFLTDEEQEIAREIKSTTVATDIIVKGIGDIVFGDIFDSKKFKHDPYDFSFDKFMDDIPYGTLAGSVALRIVTGLSGDYHGAPEEKLKLDSEMGKQAIVRLSDNQTYYKDLLEAEKISQYVKTRNVPHLRESVQDIIQKKQQQAKALRENAKAQIGQAIQGATFYVCGKSVQPKGANAKGKLDDVLKLLVEAVYSKQGMVDTYYVDDKDLKKIPVGERPEVGNETARDEVCQWLEVQSKIGHGGVTMRQVQDHYKKDPYGWRELEIAGVVAHLVFEQKVSIHYGGKQLGKEDKNLIDCLRRKSETEKTIVRLRTEPTEQQVRDSIAFLREWLVVMDIPGDKDGLVGFVKDELGKKRDHYTNLLDNYSRGSYPQKATAEAARELMVDVLSQEEDEVALLERLLAKKDDISASTKAMKALETFFDGSQRKIFDEAAKLLADIEDERAYFAHDPETTGKLNALTEILQAAEPYSRIKDLTDLMQGVRAAHKALLEKKRVEVQGAIKQCETDILALDLPAGLVKEAEAEYAGRAKDTAKAQNLMKLDAMVAQAQTYKDRLCSRAEAAEAAEAQVQKMRETPGTPDGGKKPKQNKIAQLRRADVFPAKTLATRQDVDGYLDGVRQKLYETLDASGGVQIT